MQKEMEDRVNTLKGRVDCMTEELEDIILVLNEIQDKEHDPELQNTINTLDEAFDLLKEI